MANYKITLTNITKTKQYPYVGKDQYGNVWSLHNKNMYWLLVRTLDGATTRCTSLKKADDYLRTQAKPLGEPVFPVVRKYTDISLDKLAALRVTGARAGYFEARDRYNNVWICEKPNTAEWLVTRRRDGLSYRYPNRAAIASFLLERAPA